MRLRYFYGKRLDVADFRDEQRYHAGKLRFHQQRMHGSGVLCGLRAEPFSTDPADATVLRVRRGAAVDACGRDIIVGHDQCIDVDAWLARQLQTQAAGWLDTVRDGTRLPLCIVVRYRECPSHPEPAPRDPCSCNAGGCDFGRIREEFELDLIPRPTEPIEPSLFPPRTDLASAIARSVGGAALVDAIAVSATQACPEGDSDAWIDIACFDARLADSAPADREHVIGIEALAPSETILYQTALLQELLRRELAATIEAGSLADGPEITNLQLDEKKLVVSLSSEIDPATLGSDPANVFALFRYVAGDTSGPGPWKPIQVSTTYSAAEPKLEIARDEVFAVGDRFRVVSIVPADRPIVDTAMRPLHPLRFSYHFEVVEDPDTSARVLAPISP
ncbi:MAG: hypothetical protein KIT31_02020 [Deltaproteobacteria bacterium]|nr:hypothetical protein [Deltaproteobacteria bacterium]